MKKDKQGDVLIQNSGDFKAYLDSRRNKKLYDIKDGHVVVDHVATANVLSKFIELCPMDRWIKKVMLMRVGSPLLRKKAMSHMQIALTIGATVEEVQEMEIAGKQIVGRFLQRCSADEAVEKFNKDQRNVDAVKENLVNPPQAAAEQGE